jgi:hypothetical protein
MTNNDFPPDAPEKLPVTIPFPERNVGNVKSVIFSQDTSGINQRGSRYLK